METPPACDAADTLLPPNVPVVQLLESPRYMLDDNWAPTASPLYSKTRGVLVSLAAP